MTKRRYDELSRGARRWLVARSALRGVVAVTLLVTAYYLAPLDKPLEFSTVVQFLVGLLLVAALLAWQIRMILRSDAPWLRSIQVLTVGLPLLLLVFASAHYLISGGAPGSFSEPLTKTDALYFTVTTFTTVGFGDIVPKTELARTVTLIQMVVGVVTVGIVAKLVLGAIQVAVARRGTAASDSIGGGPPNEQTQA